MNASNYVTSVIRTVVPTLWGTALAWLVSVGVLDQAAADGPGKAAGGFLVTIGVGVFYIGARWLESQAWCPLWLSGILLGTSTAPIAYVRADSPTVTGKAPDLRWGADGPEEGEHRLRD